VRLSSICVVLTGFALVACQPPPDESVTEQHTVLTPPAYTFPSTQIGNSSSHTVQINASGYSYNEIVNITESCPDFSVNWSPGEAYKTCEPTGGCIEQCPIPVSAALCGPGSETVPYYFTTTFTPTVAATVSCSVTVQTSSNTVFVSLTGTGTPPPLAADMQPPSYNFGDVRRNTTSTAASISVRNTGGQTVDVSSVSVTGVFAISGATSFSVAPGTSRAINVTCSPTAVGQTSGTLTVTSNFPGLSVPLSCNGIDSNLDISPSPLMLPTTRVGEPRTQNVTLRNSGTASMMISSVTLTGADMNLDAAPPANMMLAPNDTATATVTFGADASGDASGTLTVMYDSGQTRTSQISARALNTSMSMSPNGSVDLGPVCMGQSTSKMFSIVANDQGPFAVSSISMPAGAFSVAATGLPASVQGAGANTYTFSVSASPTELGPQTATLTVDTDIPGGEPQTTEVKVEGLAEGVNGSPAELDLGGVPVGSNTIGQSVTVTNCTTETVALTNARIEGADASQFTIVDFPETPDVAATSNAEFLIIASPDSVGAKEAMFKVDHPGGTVTINLLGDGIGDDPGVGDDTGSGRPSYYACSTGHASAAWPLLLALLALRRRRATRG
jgi:hypothetical protein